VGATVDARVILTCAGKLDRVDIWCREGTKVPFDAATPLMVASTGVVVRWCGGYSDVWPVDAVTSYGGPLEGATDSSLDG
jgi:hypothetical protein